MTKCHICKCEIMCVIETYGFGHQKQHHHQQQQQQQRQQRQQQKQQQQRTSTTTTTTTNNKIQTQTNRKEPGIREVW